jgi:hypothetical protein
VFRFCSTSVRIDLWCSRFQSLTFCQSNSNAKSCTSNEKCFFFCFFFVLNCVFFFFSFLSNCAFGCFLLFSMFSKRHASWAVMKAEDFEEDCLTSTESNKEFFTAFKLKTALVGEKIQKEYFGGFCAVLPPGSYKLVFFFVSPTKGTKVVHIPSAVSFVGKKILFFPRFFFFFF